VAELADFERIARADHGLCVVATTRDDGTVQASVVNAGVLAHPVSGAQVVALVAVGRSRKLHNLRRRRRATIVARSGWEWAAVEGPVQLFGPDDALDGLASDNVARVLRDIFVTAGGTHDDWDEYDRVMAAERRTAVFVTPARVSSNG